MALQGLRLGLGGRAEEEDDPILAGSFAGLAFTNPIGLAAGFDKDAVAVRGLSRLGFGALELGTVTPRAQTGNARPRLFRLEDGAVINRMGMNNEGLTPFARRLAAVDAMGPRKSLIGVNVGINKDGADPERDYPALVAGVAAHADYVVLNVSSPNTVGLRALQDTVALRAILAGVMQLPAIPPVFVKVAPDLTEAGLEQIVAVAIEAGVAGLVVSNTTIERPASLRGRHAAEGGGLSGPPLMGPATAMLARARRLAGGRLALIGCGGVSNGEDAFAKVKAGAAFVQMYAAFAVHGPALIPRMKRELAAALRREGFASLGDAVGTGAATTGAISTGAIRMGA